MGVTPIKNNSASTEPEDRTLPLNGNQWNALTKPTSFNEFAEAWLAIQGEFIETAQTGVLRITKSGNGGDPMRWCWPPQSRGSHSDFDTILDRAEREKKGVVFSRPDQVDTDTIGSHPCKISFPVILGNTQIASAAFEIHPSDEQQLQKTIRQLQWGTVWLEKYFLLRRNTPIPGDTVVKDRLIKVMKLLGDTLDKFHCTDAAALLTTELATMLRCDRVTVGLLEHHSIEILGLSHSASTRQKTNIIEAITAALEESVDQQETILFPANEQRAGTIIHAHKALAEEFGCSSLLTIPFTDSDGATYGAILFESTERDAFSGETQQLCEAVSALSGPVLQDKYEHDRPLIHKGLDSARRRLEKIVGPGYPGVKVSLVALLFGVLFITFAKGDFHIPADITITGEIQRSIITPFGGFVSEAHHSAGDHVKKDELLASMDTSDLTLEQLKWSSKKKQADLEYQRAIADNRTANAKIIIEQKKQAEIQLSLLDLKKERTKITAPFGGLLVKGDLSQAIGAPVERGQVLFEIVPDNGFKVILEVDERDINFIASKQEGTLKLNGLPNQLFTFAVVKITPVSTPREGKNFFQVEGKLLDKSPRLRPGMKGYGKIHIGEKKLIWIWTRSLLDRINLWFWSAV